MAEYIEREQIIRELEGIIADYRDAHTFSTDFAATIVTDILNDTVKCHPVVDVDTERLKDLVDADKDGRLIILPSKTVWELTYDAGADCDLKCPVSVDDIDCCDCCDKAKLLIYERPCTQERLERLGKSIFPTKEEAEAAFAEKAGNIYDNPELLEDNRS